MRIMVVEDNDALRRMIARMLAKKGHEIVEATDGLHAWELFQQQPVPLIVTDWLMPRMDGEQLVRQIRDVQSDAYIYIIMLTARDQSRDIVNGLEAGADDYMVKPFQRRELEARVGIAVRLLTVEQALREARDHLQEMATHDVLTGLLNRQAITRRAEVELERAGRMRQPLSLILLDVDHFKKINDRHGHLIGDQALRLVAVTLREGLRDYDDVGRWGGEEFLVVLPNTTAIEADRVAERVRRHLEEAQLLLEDGSWQPLRASLGVADAPAGTSLTLDELLQRADRALYQAKAQGRNRVHRFASPPDEARDEAAR